MSDVEFGSDEDDIVSSTKKVNNNYSDKEDGSDIDDSKSRKKSVNDSDAEEPEEDGSEDDDRAKRKKERRERRERKREERARRKEERRERGGEEEEEEDDIAAYSSKSSNREEERDYGYDDGMAEEEEEKDVIGPPIHLVHINKDPLPNRAKLMKLKVLNILGIQPQPFSTKTFSEDEPIERRKSNVESVIRWRWGVGEGGVEMKESNTRFVRWEDGSSHLFIGNEVLEVKEHELGGDHIYIYSSQDGFLECEGKLDSRLNIRPTDITSKVHRRLAESATSKSKKIGRIKTIQTTIDPEKDKEAKEKFEAELIRSRRLKENKVKSHADKIGFDSKYLEEDEQGESGYGYSNDNGFIDDEDDGDYYEDEDEDEYEEEGSSMDEFIDNSPKKSSNKRERHDDSERTKKLMKIKQSSSSSSSKSNNIFGDDDSEEDEPIRNNRGGSKGKAIID